MYIVHVYIQVIQRSLHASQCSLNSLGPYRAQHGGSQSNLSLDSRRYRRPPRTDFLELDDATLDETTDSLIGAKYVNN